MVIYAGIDEAGYGPMFGPLLVGRAVFAVDEGEMQERCNDGMPSLWRLLSRAVCRKRNDRRRRIAVNDSKKLHSPATGVRHLELGVLSFAGVGGHRPGAVDGLLDALGECCHRDLSELPWYAATDDRPWAALPTRCTDGELAVARSMLAAVAADAGVHVLDLGAAVVFEDRFNEMVAATRSKAATCFTFVSRHLDAVWQRFGQSDPTVVVDRQSGRTHYRELLALCFPDATLRVIDESAEASTYRVESSAQPRRAMTVRFEVDADGKHLPVALASMISKYVRELLMARFQSWFGQRAPQVKPTAGYARDAQRFWREIRPMLEDLHIAPEQLRRAR